MVHINRVTWVLHQQVSSLAREKVGEINALVGCLNGRIATSSVIYQVCVCGSSPTLAELPKHPVFGIPMKMDLKRLQMSWCNISSPRKLLRSTFLGWILNFRSGDMGMAISTGLEVTRHGAITWGKKGCGKTGSLGSMTKFPFSAPRSGEIRRALVFVFKRG